MSFITFSSFSRGLTWRYLRNAPQNVAKECAERTILSSTKAQQQFVITAEQSSAHITFVIHVEHTEESNFSTSKVYPMTQKGQ